VGGCVLGGLCLCFLRLAKIVTALALALTGAAVIADSGLIKAIGQEYVLWVAMGLMVLIAGYLTFKIAKVMAVSKLDLQLSMGSISDNFVYT
jgi:hypothetical protein